MRLPPIVGNPAGLVGSRVWDLFGGETLLRPIAERALRSGEPIGLRIYFDGVLNDLHAEPSGRFLRIRYRIVRQIDVTTLESLLESLRLVRADLDRPFGSPPVERP